MNGPKIPGQLTCISGIADNASEQDWCVSALSDELASRTVLASSLGSVDQALGKIWQTDQVAEENTWRQRDCDMGGNGRVHQVLH